MGTPTLTQSTFKLLSPAFEHDLRDYLLRELEESAWPDDPESDLWALPTVDSKTVIKLSPVFSKHLGMSLDPRWVRKGGYESIDAAVEHLLARAKEFLVTD